MFIPGPASMEGEHIGGQVGIVVRNNGPGIATDLYANVMVVNRPGTNSQIALERNEPDIWSGAFSFGVHASLISTPLYRLAPEAQAMPLVLKYKLAPPFTDSLEIEFLVGAGTSVPHRRNMLATADHLAALYDEFKVGCEDPNARNKLDGEFFRRLMGEMEQEQDS